MLKIGEFSKMSKLSITTLRFYETKGILCPAEIDSSTGFRYYHPGQLKQASLIKTLRYLGLSINEIEQILSGHDPREILDKKAHELELQKQKIDVSLSIIYNYLKEKDMTYKVTEKIIPEMLVYSAEATLDKYQDIMTWIPSVGQECQALNPGLKCTKPHYEFCEFLDNCYKETNIHVRHNEAVERAGVESENIKFRTIPETKVLCVQHVGPYETIGQAYGFIIKYAEDNGHKILATPRECYIDGCWNKESQDEWLTEIQLPVA